MMGETGSSNDVIARSLHYLTQLLRQLLSAMPTVTAHHSCNLHTLSHSLNSLTHTLSNVGPPIARSAPQHTPKSRTILHRRRNIAGSKANPQHTDCEPWRNSAVCSLPRPTAAQGTDTGTRRVVRTAASHGIRTTTVYTQPDALSEHAHASASSVNLGPANAYLDGEKIIRIAKGLGCDAVHPGYGFVGLLYCLPLCLCVVMREPAQ